MHPSPVLLEHRCCLRSLGQHLICAGCVLVVGAGAFNAELILLGAQTLASAPGFWLLVWLGLTAIPAVVACGFVWVGLAMRRAGGEFICQLNREEIRQFDPAGFSTFRLRLADIAAVECQSDHEGSPSWLLRSTAGAEHKLTCYDNPDDEFAEKILELRPDLTLRYTSAP